MIGQRDPSRQGFSQIIEQRLEKQLRQGSGAIGLGLHLALGVLPCSIGNRDSFSGLRRGSRGYCHPKARSLSMINAADARVTALPVLALAAIVGCYSDMPFDVVPVQGKVTYDDGTLIKSDSVLVMFNPINAERKGKMVPPGGQASVNMHDGTFSAVSTRRKADGVVVGRHKVVVVSFETDRNGNPVPSNAVPAIYRKVSTTPLEIDVKSTNQFLEFKLSRK
jgi:hypothetical protein